MRPLVACGCTLCALEINLLGVISSCPSSDFQETFWSSPRLRTLTGPQAILGQLRVSQHEAELLLSELVSARLLNPELVEGILLLAFIPTLHSTVRRVLQFQPSLAREDVAQQGLMVLLEYLRSPDLARRQSHFALAISRAVKRKLFEWALREGRASRDQHGDDREAIDRDNFEPHLLLRHFLNRCVQNRLINGDELNLLIEFKLQGGAIDEATGTNHHATNAVRQRLKRLLRKLRRLAGKTA